MVEFEAGYEEDELPASVKHGIYMVVSTAYKHREQIQTGVSVTEVPISAMRLWNNLKNWTLTNG